MPIVGMLSVFDWSEVLEMHHQWTGREWFVAGGLADLFWV